MTLVRPDPCAIRDSCRRTPLQLELGPQADVANADRSGLGRICRPRTGALPRVLGEPPASDLRQLERASEADVA